MINFAELNDLDAIMSFIDNEWKKNHILSRDKNFFLYEHGSHDQINFVVSKDDSGKLNAILGFIKASSREDADLWTVIWKVAKGVNNPMLGVELLEFLRETKARSLMSPGINSATIGIYDFLGIPTGVMKHYVLKNFMLKEFKIADFSDEIIEKKIVAQDSLKFTSIEIDDLSRFSFDQFLKCAPFKDHSYFTKRYFKHPIYNYKIYGITDDTSIKTLLVFREVMVLDHKALRLVDLLGPEEHLLNVSNAIREFIHSNRYEYLDFVCFGFDHQVLVDFGFYEVDLDKNTTIVPNYFSPYLKENIKINFFADIKDGSPFRITKADGDQDRPS